MEITDAYAHCGIRKYKPYEELSRYMQKAGVARAVLAQHRGEYDHSYIESVVRREPDRFAGVFLVDQTRPDAADEITRWSQPVLPDGRRVFRGIRIAAETLGTTKPLWHWAAQLGLNFVVDGAVAEFAGPLRQFAREMPQTSIQITHIAGPKAAESPAFPSSRPVLSLAEAPNIRVQISGLHQFAEPPYSALLPWIAQLHRAFGASRLLYASNFPVMKTEDVYRREMDLLRGGELGIPRQAAAQVMNGNAAAIWFPSVKPKRPSA